LKQNRPAQAIPPIHALFFSNFNDFYLTLEQNRATIITDKRLQDLAIIAAVNDERIIA
jgi:hypothetical protein